MSISDTIINFINKRREKVKKNFPGDLGKFYKDGGLKNVFNHININSNSTVIDTGAYKGEFADEILITFGSNLILYEPLQNEFDSLKNKYKSNKKVSLFNHAISNSSGLKFLSVDDNNSFISDTKKNNSIEIKCENIIDVLNKEKNIELIKMNIEGSEYEILEELINKNYLTKSKYYLIQFHHRNQKKFIKQKKIIEDNFINSNYIKILNYSYVWELWMLK